MNHPEFNGHDGDTSVTRRRLCALLDELHGIPVPAGASLEVAERATAVRDALYAMANL